MSNFVSKSYTISKDKHCFAFDEYLSIKIIKLEDMENVKYYLYLNDTYQVFDYDMDTLIDTFNEDLITEMLNSKNEIDQVKEPNLLNLIDSFENPTKQITTNKSYEIYLNGIGIKAQNKSKLLSEKKKPFNIVPFCENHLNITSYNSLMYILDNESNIYKQMYNFKLYLEENMEVYLNPKEYDGLLGTFNTKKTKNYDYLGFLNGAYNIETKEFITKSDNPLLPYLSLKHNYDPKDWEDPTFQRFIKTSSFIDLRDEHDKPVNIDILKGTYETIGLLLQSGNRHKTIVIVFGVPNSGKGVFVMGLTDIFGFENKAVLKKNDVDTKEEFNAVGKKIVIFNEVPGGYDKNHENKDNAFKERSSGNDSVQIKGLYKQGIELSPEDVYIPVLVGNDNPFPKPDPATKVRLQYVPLNKSILPEEQDMDLSKKIREEIPAIINKSLEAVSKINHFSELEFRFDEKQIDTIMERFANPFNVIFEKINLQYILKKTNEIKILTNEKIKNPSIDELNDIIEKTAKDEHLQIAKYNNSYKNYIFEYVKENFDSKVQSIERKKIDSEWHYESIYIENKK